MSIFTQLTFSKKAEWNYKSGFFNHNGELTLFPEKSEIDIPKVWRTIDSLGVRTLPDQNDTEISIEKKGKLYSVSEEIFERLTASHGGLTTIELFNEDGYRTYSWVNPIQLSNSLNNSKQNWVAPELHSMAEIERTIAAEFSISDNFKIYVKEIMEKRR